MEQGTFEDIELQEKITRARVTGCERERRLKGVALTIDRKTLSAYLDVSYSYVSEVLNTNNEAGQKPMPTKWHGAIMLLAPERYMSEVAAFDEDVCGYEHPPKKRQLTVKELFEKVVERIDQCHIEKLFEDIL
jgi:hypothetical protein